MTILEYLETNKAGKAINLEHNFTTVRSSKSVINRALLHEFPIQNRLKPHIT